MEFNEKYLDKFLTTAIERHWVYTNKKGNKAKPWTMDPIFQNYFFCCVFRQYDKCSKWIIDNVVPLVNEDITNWELLILYRYISTYEIFKYVEEHNIINDIDRVYQYLFNVHASGKKIFNGCFIRNPRIKGGWVSTYKVPFYLIKEIQEHEGYLKQCLEESSLQSLTEFFSSFSATKGFMGYEYACDFEYTKWFYPKDKYTWCNKGPGAQRGMSWLVCGNPNEKFTDDQWTVYTQQLYEIMNKPFEKIFPKENITMREVEHWLCEFQKYVKYKVNYDQGIKCKHRKYQGV